MKKLAFSVFAAALTFGANAADRAKAANVAKLVKETKAVTDTCCGYDGFYVGLGIATIDDGIRIWNSSEDETESDHKVKLAGTLALGYGKRIKEKAYLGLEAGVDVSQHSEFNQKEVIINGLVPSAALKLGFVHPKTGIMGYLKAGAAYSRVKLAPEHVTAVYGNYKWSPLVALGGEKLCGNLRTRLEAEYRFRTKKDFTGLDDQGDTVNYELTNRGAITFKLMAIYTIKR